MPPIANSAGTSIEALRAAITMLTKLDHRWRKTGSKRALYRYLATVFKLCAAWKHAGDARSGANRIARLAGSSVQHCESARGPDADRHAKPLIHLAVEGSLVGAYLQFD